MTVTYTAEVSTCRGFGCFVKLLYRWRGSIYKLVWPDLFLFLGSYFTLSIMYRFMLSPQSQKTFAEVVILCDKQGTLIPLSFVLGFYVTIVVGRWWDQYKTIPWPDSIALLVSACLNGQDERGRLQRRTIMRYVCLSSTMCFTLVSPRVKKRFPTLDHLVLGGLLHENERKIIEDINVNVPGYSKTWLPIVWASSIVSRARKEGRITSDIALKAILEELNKFRGQSGLLLSYDWISVPLVYTQVVTLAVYSYFLSCVMGRQNLIPEHRHMKSGSELDLVFPIFTMLEFFFYMGWLKVAESLVNPFGDDDDDFEVNWLVDRNLQVSYLIVDEMHKEDPELVKDQYWDQVFPSELPYTVAAEQFRDEPPIHSTDKIQFSRQNSEIVSPPSVKLDDLGECLDGRKSSSQRYSRRERPSSIRSNASFSTSVGDRISHAGSFTSLFRRLLPNKERDGSMDFSGKGTEEIPLGSNAALVQVSHNLVDEIIPELDENAVTIISMKGGSSDTRPTAVDVFNVQSDSPESIPKSKNIDIPEHKKVSVDAEDMLIEEPSIRLSTMSAPPNLPSPPSLPHFPILGNQGEGDVLVPFSQGSLTTMIDSRDKNLLLNSEGDPNSSQNSVNPTV